MDALPERFVLSLCLLRDTAQDAIGYVGNTSAEAFAAEPLRVDAVMMKLIVMGELANTLIAKYPSLVAQSDIPWDQMRGMRNRIAHGYFEVDHTTVWQTVVRDLPTLMSV